MRIEILTIGDELLDGRVADTNTLFFAELVEARGFEIVQRTTVRDHKKEIQDALDGIIFRGTNFCVLCGGLGPTSDDLTSEVFASWAGKKTIRHFELVEKIEARLKRTNRSLNESQLKQADIPEGAEIIENNLGTAAGFKIEHRGCEFVVLPGVPFEYKAMLPQLIAEKFDVLSQVGIVEKFKLYGQAEGQVNEVLKEIIPKCNAMHFKVSYRADFPYIDLGFYASREDADAMSSLVKYVKEEYGRAIISRGDETIFDVMLEHCRENKITLSFAESCTGGLLSHLFTELPGSSAVLLASYVTYSDEAKQEMLGVKSETLREFGAVSLEVARQMTLGAQNRSGATYSLSITGIAGPGGGSEEKPVGRVCLALASAQGILREEILNLPYERSRNKVKSAAEALNLLRLECLR